MSATIRETCVRAQQAWKDADAERRRVFAIAIEQGVTYRALAKEVGISHSYLYSLVHPHAPTRATSETILDRPMPS